MTKYEKIEFLIKELQEEMPEYKDYQIPSDVDEAWKLLRAFFNIRPPYPLKPEFESVQDDLLKQIAKEKGITDVENLKPIKADSRLYIWQGDITALKVDAAVNAANSQMEGCWSVGHTCVDNNFHSFASCAMRVECHRQMSELRNKYGQNYLQPTAVPMITSGYNLPAKNVIHVVGPIVQGRLKQEYKDQLYECYRASLQMAADHGCKSIAFCCISTGVFMFPNEAAAEIAVKAVKDYLKQDERIEKVVFNVFKDIDLLIYNNILGE